MEAQNKKKTIGLVGYYNFGNYGDELFAQAFRKAMPEFNFQILHDICERPYFTTPKAEKVKNVDCILIGGGDLIIPSYWTDLYFEDEFLEKPVYIAGVGVPTWAGNYGSNNDPKVIERLRKFMRHPNVRFISVRDVESKEWIEKFLQPRIEVHVSADLVCSLDFPKANPSSSEKIFGLITRKQGKGEIQYQNIRKLCGKAIGEGYKIKQIILATGEIGKEDYEEIHNFQFPGIELVYTEDIDKITQEISTCNVMASMKFHGCVVASMMGIPAITLITTDKFVNFYKAINREDLISHHRRETLADQFSPDIQPIDPATIASLKASSLKMLNELKDAINQGALSSTVYV